MKKRFTKVLSLLIAVMLVIGIMPTTFAEDGELELSGVKIVYDIGSSQASVGSQKFTTTNNFWETISYPTSNFSFIANSKSKLQVNISAGAWWAVKVNVPKSGLYTFKINKSTNRYGGKSKIYFSSIENEIDYILNNGEIGTVDFTDSTATSGNTTNSLELVSVGDVKVTRPGEYIIIFYASEDVTVDSKKYARQYFREVILDGCESGTEVAGVIGSVKFNGSDSISAGNNAELSVIAYDGIEATALVTDSVTYESSDDTILSIDGATAAAHKAGTVTVTANAEGWGNPVETTVTVDPSVPYSDIAVKYSVEISSYSAGLDMTAVKFADTNGFWSFEDQHGNPVVTRNTNYGIQVQPDAGDWWAMRIYVPKAGTYDLKFNHGVTTDAGVALVYFGSALNGVTNVLATQEVGHINFYASSSSSTLRETPVGTVEIAEPGEYIIVLKRPSNADASALAGYDITTGRQYFKSIILDGCTGDEENYVPMLNVTADKSVITEGNTTTVTATSTLMSDGATTITPEISYTSNDVVTVDNSGNVTTNKDGIATVTATATIDEVSSSRSVNITVNNKEISDAFDVVSAPEEDYIAPSVNGITVDGTAITPDENSDGSYNLTAPETKEGSSFLYWAMGMSANKRIVSFDATLKNYVPEGNGVNYLIPVYADDVAENIVEYYNINGQRIAALPVGATAPDYPSIPGIGGAKGWKECAGNVYVAEYESVTAYDKVTVNGEEVDYGTKIECKSDEKEGTFRFWKKTVNGSKTEVVSLDSEYSFYAWEDTTVEAVYGDETPTFTGEKFRIIIGSFDVDGATGVMAEFIGLSDAVEKGIMFTANGETRKMAMTTKDNQFTVIANESGTYTGYAIVGNEDEGFTLITDGLYTKE